MNDNVTDRVKSPQMQKTYIGISLARISRSSRLENTKQIAQRQTLLYVYSVTQYFFYCQYEYMIHMIHFFKHTHHDTMYTNTLQHTYRFYTYFYTGIVTIWRLSNRSEAASETPEAPPWKGMARQRRINGRTNFRRKYAD